MEIKGKIVVITGASSGIGRETAIHLAGKGAKLVLVARSEKGLKEVQDKIGEATGEQSLPIQCDISDEREVVRMANNVKNEIGRVDVLINNAGIGTYRVSEKLSNEEMRRHFEVNFFGAYYCIQALLPMLKQHGGYILNVGSLFGRHALFPDVSVYAATKFAVAGFSDGLRRELKPYGIGVGHLMPGPVRTPFQDKKGEGERKTPSFLMIEPARVARVIEQMIRRNKKSAVVPKWQQPLFWLGDVFGR